MMPSIPRGRLDAGQLQVEMRRFPLGRALDASGVRPQYPSQDVHQPLAVTSLPSKMTQAPVASPGLAVKRLQLSHTAVGSLRSVDLVASILYFTARAFGS